MKPAVAELFFIKVQALLSLQLCGTKEELHNGSFLVNFTSFCRITFQVL